MDEAASFALGVYFNLIYLREKNPVLFDSFNPKLYFFGVKYSKVDFLEKFPSDLMDYLGGRL